MAVAVILTVTGIHITPSNSLKVDAAETGWTLVWSDEFNGTSLDRSVWNYDIGTGDWGWGNGEIQYYTDKADNVSVSDGSLKITAKRENYNGSAYTSGRINTLGKKAFKYGKMEARIKVEGGNQNGVWPAFWMMGNNMASGTNWPYCGELDIMEHANNRNYVEGTLHWNAGGIGAGYNHVFWGSYSGGQYYYFPDNVNNGINGWHTYGVIWDEQKIQWYVDDNIYLTGYLTADNAYAFQKEQFFLLNLALGGPQTGYTGNTTVDGSFSSATMYVDYVRAYQAGGSGDVTVPTNPIDPGDGLTATSSQKTNLGGWGYYLLGGNSGRYSGGTSLSDPFTLKIVNNNKASWNTQAFTKEMDVTPGHTYKCSVDINSDAASGAILMKDEVGGTELVSKGLTPGNNVFEGTCKASDNGKLQLMFNLTEVNAGTTLKFSNVKITDTTSGEVITTNVKPVQTTAQHQTPKPTSVEPVDPSKKPINPIGLVANSENDNQISVVWGQTNEMLNLGQVYNVYIDNKKVSSEVGCGSYTYDNISAGVHTVGITAVLGGQETQPLTAQVTVAGGNVTPPQTTAPQQTTVPIQTTTPMVQPDTTVSSDMKFEQIAGMNQEIIKGNFGMWINETNIMDIAVDPADANHIQGKIVSNNNNWDPWAVQYKVKKAGLKSGEEYTISVDMKASGNDGVLSTDGDKASVDLKESTNVTLTSKVKADENGNIVFTIGAGQVGIGVILDFSNVVVKDSKGNIVGDTSVVPPQTTSVPQTTAVPPQTTAAPQTTPTPQTTAAPPQTTEGPRQTTEELKQTTVYQPVTTVPSKDTTKIVVKKTKVRKAIKKKAAKKIKITLKRITGASSYQVKVSIKKKFNNKKKITITKTVKKATFTIKIKRLKKAKNYYVKARAIRVVNKKKYYGKWSNRKKVKIKK